jgi:hypothetical protein
MSKADVSLNDWKINQEVAYGASKKKKWLMQS